MIALINRFSMSTKIKTEEFSKTLNRILKTTSPKLHIDGEYLKKNGMKEGESLGKVLNLIEKEWIDKIVKISKNRIIEIIRDNSN